jgi:hypothetical protein
MTGQILPALHSRRDHLQSPYHPIVRNLRLDMLGRAIDHHQQVVEIMGNSAGKLADGFHSL